MNTDAGSPSLSRCRKEGQTEISRDYVNWSPKSELGRFSLKTDANYDLFGCRSRFTKSDFFFVNKIRSQSYIFLTKGLFSGNFSALLVDFSVQGVSL